MRMFNKDEVKPIGSCLTHIVRLTPVNDEDFAVFGGRCFISNGDTMRKLADFMKSLSDKLNQDFNIYYNIGNGTAHILEILFLEND